MADEKFIGPWVVVQTTPGGNSPTDYRFFFAYIHHGESWVHLSMKQFILLSPKKRIPVHTITADCLVLKNTGNL